MTATTMVTKSAKVIAALVNGEELTGKQISARFGVANARALISSLRMQGYSVYCNQRTSRVILCSSTSVPIPWERLTASIAWALRHALLLQLDTKL